MRCIMFNLALDVTLHNNTLNFKLGSVKVYVRICAVNRNQPGPAIAILYKLAKPTLTIYRNDDIGPCSADLGGLDDDNTLLRKLGFHAVIQDLKRVELVVTTVLGHLYAHSGV